MLNSVLVDSPRKLIQFEGVGRLIDAEVLLL